MPDRPLRRKEYRRAQPGSRSPDALLAEILSMHRTGGEDFWVISIVVDSDEPSWERRTSFTGTYEKAAALAVATLGIMAQSGELRKGTRLEFFQAENARAYLVRSAIQERRYQQEREAEPNN